MTAIQDRVEEAAGLPVKARQRWATARQQHREERARRREEQQRSPRLERIAAAVVALAVLAVGTYAAVYAYDSIYNLAKAHHDQLARWAPIGFEASMAVAVLTDIYWTWKGTPVWFLRWLSRILIGFSIAGNAAAGWPDPVSVMIHLPAPIVFAAIVESLRHVLIRRLKEAARVEAEAAGNQRHDPIPMARWINDPWGSYLFWRRWNMYNPSNPSYLTQVSLEVRRLQALRALREHFERRSIAQSSKPKSWRKLAPDEYLWMLKRGIEVEDTHAAIMRDYPPLVVKKTLQGTGDSGPPGHRRNRHRTDRARTSGTDRRRETGTDSGTDLDGGSGTDSAADAGTEPRDLGSPEWIKWALAQTEAWMRANGYRFPSGDVWSAQVVHKRRSWGKEYGGPYERIKQALGGGK